MDRMSVAGRLAWLAEDAERVAASAGVELVDDAGAVWVAEVVRRVGVAVDGWRVAVDEGEVDADASLVAVVDGRVDMGSTDGGWWVDALADAADDAVRALSVDALAAVADGVDLAPWFGLAVENGSLEVRPEVRTAFLAGEVGTITAADDVDGDEDGARRVALFLAGEAVAWAAVEAAGWFATASAEDAATAEAGR